MKETLQTVWNAPKEDVQKSVSDALTIFCWSFLTAIILAGLIAYVIYRKIFK